MTISAVPPRLIDANEFWDTYADREPTYELVAGIPVMTPPRISRTPRRSDGSPIC